jgi:hypothetical protein
MSSLSLSSNVNVDDIHEVNSSIELVEDRGLSKQNDRIVFPFFSEIFSTTVNDEAIFAASNPEDRGCGQ